MSRDLPRDQDQSERPAPGPRTGEGPAPQGRSERRRLTKRARRRRLAEWQAADAVCAGATLRQAAAAAGVHVSTLCRWLNDSPAFAAALARAGRLARLLAQGDGTRWAPRPRQVAIHPRCPRCQGAVVTYRPAFTADMPFPFWRCARWPACPYASWRPRAPADCPRCGGPQFWTHSRKHVRCDRCRRFERVKD